MSSRKRLFPAIAAALALVACDDKPSAPTARSATTAAATPSVAAAAPSASAPAEAPKPKKARKTAADCPKGPAVAFEDPKVEEEIRKKLGKATGDVTRADLGKLKSLNLSQLRLESLDPCVIPHAKNLKELFLGPGDLDDLTPLEGLTKLESLRASINQVRDIAPLAGMKKLDRLDLGRTQITNLVPLRELTSLTELAIDDTPVRDLTPLSGLTKLERLSIQRTYVKDFTPLKDLKSLKFLYVAGTPATDTSVLQPLRANGLRIIDQ